MKNETRKMTNLNGFSIEFYPNGKPLSFRKGNVLINLFSPSLADAAIANLYLRVFTKNEIKVLPIFGNSDSFSSSEKEFLWRGSFESVDYSLRLVLNNEDCWFFTAELAGTSKKSVEADLVYVQDTGLADGGMIKSNESYVSQYLDKAIYKDDIHGYIVCSRQNMHQDTVVKKKCNPWLMQGSLGETVAFVTDGFDLYTTQSRLSGKPEALFKKNLPSKNRQYEFSLTGLQSCKKRLAEGQTAKVVFFSVFKDDHSEPSSESDLSLLASIKDQYDILAKSPSVGGTVQQGEKDRSILKDAAWFVSKKMTEKEIFLKMPAPFRNIEKGKDGLLSFFHSEEVHTVCKTKDILVDRPHGMICFSAEDLDIKENILSTTFWMQGVFQSQVSIGNVNFHRFLTINRNHLNCLRLSGQRIFIRTAGKWEQLGLPSLFEMGTNFARWHYSNEDRDIAVTAWVMDSSPITCTEIEITRGAGAEFLITNNYGQENDSPDETRKIDIDQAKGQARIIVGDDEMSRKHYPELSFALLVNDNGLVEKICRDEPLFSDGLSGNLPVVSIKTKEIKKISILMTGVCVNESEFLQRLKDLPQNWPDFSTSRKAHLENRKKLLGGLSISAEKNKEMEKLQEIIPWFFHCGLVHYHVPHGLEQFGGAAWGLRDVCQGPVEMFLALGQDRTVKNILKKVFTQQFIQTGNWPQYFMFDRYNHIQNRESHGDVIVWPLYSLSLYCEQTSDLSILQEVVAYTDHDTLNYTEQKDTILDHVFKLVKHIRENVLPGTALSRYEEGDWDDTLQPAQDEFRARMASGWTIPLTYQSLKRMSSVLLKAGMKEKAEEFDALAKNIHADFQKFFMSDKTIAGFIRLEKNGEVTKLLHPSDKVTGIKYRLLPMTRSVISGVFSPEQAAYHLKLVDQYLVARDGARLMDAPAPYSGGNSKIFKRAEQAANFGREIGLMYTHAHIRFVESLEVIGDCDRAFNMLMKVNPILLNKVVPNALTRQSNAYFSSSDALFADRYEAAANYRKVYSGKVSVLGGWRVYSSGPGLWMGNLIFGLMGIRRNFGNLVIDPVLPSRCDGIKFNLELNGLQMRFTLHTRGYCSEIRKITVNGKEMDNLKKSPNLYRPGGVNLDWKEVEKAAAGKAVEIEIWR